MKLSKCLPSLLPAVLASLFLVAPNVRAASIFIDAANLKDRVAFNFGQFEGGFSINGSTPITTGGAVFGDGTQLNFTGQWIDLGAATSFARTVFWINPKRPSTIAEILQWSITPSGPSGLATISGFFEAANPLNGGVGPLPINVNPADVIIKQKNGAHDPFNFSAAFLGGQVITGRAVPEPSTYLLFLLGGLGVFGARFRRRGAAT